MVGLEASWGRGVGRLEDEPRRHWGGSVSLAAGELLIFSLDL